MQKSVAAKWPQNMLWVGKCSIYKVYVHKVLALLSAIIPEPEALFACCRNHQESEFLTVACSALRRACLWEKYAPSSQTSVRHSVPDFMAVVVLVCFFIFYHFFTNTLATKFQNQCFFLEPLVFERPFPFKTKNNYKC